MGRRALALAGRVLRAQQAGDPLPLPVHAQPSQPLHQDRVVFHRGRVLEELTQQVVVSGCGNIETLSDRLFLDAGMLPPRAFEVEDLDVAAATTPCVCPCCESMARTGRRGGFTADQAPRRALREKAAREVSFCDSADSDPVGRLPHREVPVHGDLMNFGERIVHDASKTVVDLLFGPEEAPECLAPTRNRTR